MKSIALKTSLAAIVLGLAASTVSVASANDSTPSGVLLLASSQITAKKPARARPDYIVTKVVRSGGNPKQLTITVKNQGAEGNEAGSELYATVIGGDIGSAAVAMPDLKAGQSMTMFVNFFKAPDRGARIRVTADGNKRVAESNEDNNVKYFTY